MGFFLKSRITEAEAADLFVAALVDRIKGSWPELTRLLGPAFDREGRALERESGTQLQIVLAVAAAHQEQLPRAFEPAQAERISQNIVKSIARRAPGVDVAGGVGAYREAWARAESPGGSAVEALAEALYEQATMRYTGRNDAPAPPSAESVRLLANLLRSLDFSWWKHLLWRYRVIPT